MSRRRRRCQGCPHLKRWTGNDNREHRRCAWFRQHWIINHLHDINREAPSWCPLSEAL